LLDRARTGIGGWLVAKQMKDLEEDFKLLVKIHSIGNSGDEDLAWRKDVIRNQLVDGFRVMVALTEDPTAEEDLKVTDQLISASDVSAALEECCLLMLEENLAIDDAFRLVYIVASSLFKHTENVQEMDPKCSFILALCLLRSIRTTPSSTPPSNALDIAFKIIEDISIKSPSFLRRTDSERLQMELGLALAHQLDDTLLPDWGDQRKASLYITSFIDFLHKQLQPDTVAMNEEDEYDDYAEYDDSGDGLRGLTLMGIDERRFNDLVTFVDSNTEEAKLGLARFKSNMSWSDDHVSPLPPSLSYPPPPIHIPGGLDSLRRALDPSHRPSNTQRTSMPDPPSTPPTILGLASLSPFTVLRSPTTKVSSLTKTYINNDFRQLRTSPHTNTSRPPSMHVDVSLVCVTIQATSKMILTGFFDIWITTFENTSCSDITSSISSTSRMVVRYLYCVY